ncbi:hypothetical protein ACT4ML_10175 [Natrinema sp. LN54]
MKSYGWGWQVPAGRGLSEGWLESRLVAPTEPIHERDEEGGSREEYRL